MIKSALIILQFAFILCGSCLSCFAEGSARLVSKANRLYRQEKYDEAVKLYNEAQIKSPDSAEINYNIGIAQYKKEDYASAIGFFERATASRDKALESKANFNIANSKYKLGKLKENTELKETVNLLRQSLDYYKRTIELNSKDEDARINHELVERELKILLDRLKQEQEKKKDQSGQEKEKKEGQAQSQEGEQEDKQGQQAQQAAKAEGQEEAKAASEAKQAEEEKQARVEESKGQAAEEEAREMS
ncbi:MAG: tetratricopeptide repeat protein, partial [Candidatus Omnitrophica bacterium]|nr:tetratricopeptide repeat protein [Candidatus Omnitrophota bacterium]